MEEATGAVDALTSANAVLDAVLANPEPIGAIGLLLALGVGGAKRFGGGRFVMLVESIPMVAVVIHALGEIVTKVGDVLDTLYTAIKEAQKPVAVVLLLLVLPMLLGGCAFSGGGYGVNAAWTIGDGQVSCNNTDGYPTGENCIASGAEAVAVLAEASTYLDEPVEAE